METKKLFPSLGYFGGIQANRLELPVNRQILGVRLSLAASVPEFLNLRGLLLYRDGFPLDIDSIGHTVQLSSVRPQDEQKDPARLLRRGSIHSAKELNPWWEIRFQAPVQVDLIAVENRVDNCGMRSRSLNVELLENDGSCVLLYAGDTIEAAEHSLAFVERFIEPRSKVPGFSSEEIRKSLLKSVVTKIQQDSPEQLTRAEGNLLAGLLPQRMHVPDEDVLMLLAYIFLMQRRATPGTVTGIQSFSNLLNSRARLDRLCELMNELAPKLDLAPQMISRHGVHDMSQLKLNPDTHLSHMQDVVLAMQELGYESGLCYGTLLGSVREGAFLAHDDDVDLFFVAKSTSAEELANELETLGRSLRALGFKYKRPNAYWNRHVVSPRGAAVDLFPALRQEDGFRMHMERMSLGHVPVKMLLPMKLGELEGRLFPVPHDPEGFLALRYGEGWSVSDPYYEWYWKLDDGDSYTSISNVTEKQ